MKIWKNLIRIWLTLISLISFLVGWVVLAHAPKPKQFTSANIPAAPQLAPIPSLDQVINSDQSQGQSFFNNVQSASPFQSRPVLRSGGS